MSLSFEVGVMFRNNEAFVGSFFYFLRRSTQLPFRVIAVDQGSTDATGALLSQCLRGPDTAITLEENIGGSQGLNLILKARDKDLPFLMMDSDVFVSLHNSVDCLRYVLASQPDVGVVHGLVNSFWPDGNDEYGSCFAMLSPQAINEVGEFDSRLKYYYYDSDYWARLTQANYRIVHIQTARCLHLWGSTLTYGSERPYRKSQLALDKAIYEEKYNLTSIN